MKKTVFIVGLVSALALSGCAPFVVGAAAGGAGAAVVYDKRELETIKKDHTTSYLIDNKINNIAGIDRSSHIAANSFNSVVLLTGQTSAPEIRQEVDAIAQATPGVKRVYNEIKMEPPTAPLVRANDTWLTTKIKTQMLLAKELRSGQIKVITENGTVYLMGVVSPKQAQLAVRVARKVEGVQKVVRVFQQV